MSRLAAAPMDQHDPQYKCCCGCFHVRMGAFIIGIIELIALGINVVAAGVGSHDTGAIAGSVIGFVIVIVVVTMMLVGVAKDMPVLILPHLILQTIAIILVTVGFVGLIAMAAINSPYIVQMLYLEDRVSPSTSTDSGGIVTGIVLAVLVVALVLLLLTWIFEVWFILVILSAYRYARDMRYSRNLGYGGGDHVFGVHPHDLPSHPPSYYPSRLQDEKYY